MFCMIPVKIFSHTAHLNDLKRLQILNISTLVLIFGQKNYYIDIINSVYLYLVLYSCNILQFLFRSYILCATESYNVMCHGATMLCVTELQCHVSQSCSVKVSHSYSVMCHRATVSCVTELQCYVSLSYTVMCHTATVSCVTELQCHVSQNYSAMSDRATMPCVTSYSLMGSRASTPPHILFISIDNFIVLKALDRIIST